MARLERWDFDLGMKSRSLPGSTGLSTDLKKSYSTGLALFISTCLQSRDRKNPVFLLFSPVQ